MVIEIKLSIACWNSDNFPISSANEGYLWLYNEAIIIPAGIDRLVLSLTQKCWLQFPQNLQHIIGEIRTPVEISVLYLITSLDITNLNYSDYYSDPTNLT